MSIQNSLEESGQSSPGLFHEDDLANSSQTNFNDVKLVLEETPSNGNRKAFKATNNSLSGKNWLMNSQKQLFHLQNNVLPSRPGHRRQTVYL